MVRVLVTSRIVVRLIIGVVWTSLKSGVRHPSLSAIILTVIPDPPLCFPSPDVLNKNLIDISNSSTTPVSTPLPSTFSPDQSGLASTPGGSTAQTNAPTPTSGAFDYSAEAKLVDITDETWGFVMPRCFDDSHGCLGSCPASISGYLIKRTGARDEDGLIALGVNIVHAQKPDKLLVKEVLRMYRGLGLLARVRGIIDPVSSLLPWHIAAARKAHATVSSTMLWTGE